MTFNIIVVIGNDGNAVNPLTALVVVGHQEDRLAGTNVLLQQLPNVLGYRLMTGPGMFRKRQSPRRDQDDRP